MADLVIAKGMQFWGTHGYYPEENKFGAKFIVDVEALADEDAMCQYDELEGGVSYMTLYGCAKKVVTEEQHKLLQRVAQRISD
jgi:dihydroneopterin aldolase